MRRPSLGTRYAAAAALAIALGPLLGAAPAAANTPIFSFSVTPSTTQAGGHPNLNLHASFGSENTNDSDAENLTTELPAGLIANPHAVPQCTEVQFALESCPVDSQVGFENYFGVPIYNLVPHQGEAGLLGLFTPFGEFPVFQAISPRTNGDYGLTISIIGLYHGGIKVGGFDQTIWGVPADPSHDPLRCGLKDPYCTNFGQHSNSPLTPYLENPTTCGAPLSSSMEILSYDDGTSDAECPYPATTGCDQLSFNPSLYAQPTTSQTDSASGLAVDLSVPQEESPTIPSPSEIRATTVTLPEGFSINPNAADGKTSCSDAEAHSKPKKKRIARNSPRSAPCTRRAPPSPALSPATSTSANRSPATATGSFWSPTASPPTSSWPASRIPDPQTGQLTVTFGNLPQTPFTDFNLHFFGSERGLLATPTQCGTYPVISTFTPWDPSLPSQTSTQFFSLDSGPNGGPCPAATRPFNPGFEAVFGDSTAGAHTPFSIELTRPDGDQNLSALTVATPPGFSATLAGVPYCPDAALTAAAEPSYSGLARGGQPELPRGQPDRHRRHRGGRRHPPRLRLRQGLPRRPLQRRPALAWR